MTEIVTETETESSKTLDVSADIVAEAPAAEKPIVTGAAAETAAAPKRTMDITEIMAILPHRYPFLLIDRVLEIEPRQRIVAIKNVTINEPQFTGHFPDFPIMPAVMTIEAMAQAGGALLLTEIPDRESKLMVFTGIDKASFRRQVVPGDQLRIEVTVLKWRSRVVKMQGICSVEGKVAAEAEITCMLVPHPKKIASQHSAK